MIVVDLGCHGHGMYDSIGSLIQHYNPEILYGFDPHPDTEEGVRIQEATTVVTRKLAAWITDGSVPFVMAGTGSRVGRGRPVPCFNLCSWLNTLPGKIVLKMDVEGAEFALAKALKRTRMDTRLELLLVEKHGGSFWPQLRCPVEEWWM